MKSRLIMIIRHKHANHALIFSGLLVAYILDRFYGFKDAAHIVAIVSNGLWLARG